MTRSINFFTVGEASNAIVKLWPTAEPLLFVDSQQADLKFLHPRYHLPGGTSSDPGDRVLSQYAQRTNIPPNDV